MMMMSPPPPNNNNTMNISWTPSSSPKTDETNALYALRLKDGFDLRYYFAGMWRVGDESTWGLSYSGETGEIQINKSTSDMLGGGGGDCVYAPSGFITNRTYYTLVTKSAWRTAVSRIWNIARTYDLTRLSNEDKKILDTKHKEIIEDATRQ